MWFLVYNIKKFTAFINFIQNYHLDGHMKLLYKVWSKYIWTVFMKIEMNSPWAIVFKIVPLAFYIYSGQIIFASSAHKTPTFIWSEIIR